MPPISLAPSLSILVYVFLLVVSNLACVTSIESSPHTYREIQPDGKTTPPLKIRGGPQLHYVTDANGYTVIQDDDRWFVYADEGSDETGRLSSSGMRVGMGAPEKKGIHKGILPGHSAQVEQCGRLCDLFNDDGIHLRRLSPDQTSTTKEPERNLSTPTTGVLKNLVVLMKFSDHQDRIVPSKADVDLLMNAPGGDPDLAPTGSVRDVFAQASYDQLVVDSTVYNWVILPNTEQYYADNESAFTDVFVEALHDALDIIDSDPAFSFLDFDVNGDGTIDAVTFLHSGYGAEWSGTDCYGNGRSHRIWSHKWTMPSRFHWYSSNGVRVNKYYVSPAVWGTCGSDIGRIGVIAHELGHFLGLPDLYDGKGGEGAGSFDLMGNSWGFDGSQYYPPILSAWSKIRLGWASPIILDVEGQYSLAPWASSPAVYRIDKGFPEGEYLLIENRQQLGFDSQIPQGGLAIWHIDEWAPYNNEGHPDQDDWPLNGNHYKVALLQADGNYDLEKGNSRGDSGDLWHSNTGSVVALAPSMGRVDGPYPNSDAYKGGKIIYTGIRIYNVKSLPNKTMSFQLSFDDSVSDNDATEPTQAPPFALTPYPTSAPTDSPPTSNEIVSTFANGNGSAGNCFDVVSKTTVRITGIDIHTVSTSTVSVEVWTKSGSHVGYENSPDMWQQIASTSVMGQGLGNRTPIPRQSLQPFEIRPSQRQAFYVTLTTRDIRYSDHLGLGQIGVANSDLELYVGTGQRYPFGEIYTPRLWNGALTYETIDDSEALPTITPTGMPTDVFWSAFPSMLPSIEPTKTPSVSPTAAPITAAPTSGPSSVPSNSPSHIPSIPPTTAAPSKYTPSTAPSGKPSHSPITTAFSSSLTTTLSGGTGQAGNQFDVIAAKDLVIFDLSIHTSSTKQVTIEVWTKRGTFRDSQKNAKAWKRVARTTTRGQGAQQLTPLPMDAMIPVKVEADEKVAFYVTLTTAEMRYTKGRKVGQIFASNDDLSILEGAGKSYPFKTSYVPRVWNGAIKYVLQPDGLTGLLPTSFPTPSPSLEELWTTMDGGNGQAGNMFDVVAMKDIVIVGIGHVHTSSVETVNVEIWTKEGPFKGFQRDRTAWSQVAAVSVRGKGRGQPTVLPKGIMDRIEIGAGETRSFYVTLTTPDMRYTNGDYNLPSKAASNADLRIHRGIGKAYPFKTTYKSRVFNGSIVYFVRG